MIRVNTIILLFSGMWMACNQDRGTQSIKTLPYYTINEPDKEINLPDELQEISGLAYIDHNRLAAIQDESGIIFIYDLEQNQILKEIEFGESGDYEGIALVEDDAYILESNGKLHQVSNYLSESPAINIIHTGLDKKADAEGLCYDPTLGYLLIACKETPNNSKAENKSVFAFDVQNQVLLEEPFLKINLKAIEDSLFQEGVSSLAFEVRKELSPTGLADLFKPSGIALHPKTDNFYILSAKNKLMAVVDRKGTLLHIVDFASPLMRQPEGICFAPEATLYLSNEGQDGPPNILEYNYARN